MKSVVDYSRKIHGSCITSCDSLPSAEEGISTVTIGLLGLGKLMSSNTTGSSDMFIGGVTMSDG